MQCGQGLDWDYPKVIYYRYKEISDISCLNLHAALYAAPPRIFGIKGDHYEIYNSDEDGATYRLIYSYNVNDKQYTVSTDYGTNMIPKEGSTRVIKYNPANPSEAIILGGSSDMVLLLIGIMFTMIPIIMFMNISSKVKEKVEKLNFNLTSLLIGIVFLMIGLMALYMMTGTFSIIEIYKSFRLNYLIPYLILLMFIIVGSLLIINSFKKNSV